MEFVKRLTNIRAVGNYWGVTKSGIEGLNIGITKSGTEGFNTGRGGNH